MRRALLAPVLAAAALLPAGCALLAARPLPDAPMPASMRAALAPARAALLDAWAGTQPAWFAFDGARCAIGAGTVLVFRQQVAGESDGYALALTRDLAAGILSGRWQTRFDVADPASDPTALELVGGRELPCP